jgi:hypothetical protein
MQVDLGSFSVTSGVLVGGPAGDNLAPAGAPSAPPAPDDPVASGAGRRGVDEPAVLVQGNCRRYIKVRCPPGGKRLRVHAAHAAPGCVPSHTSPPADGLSRFVCVQGLWPFSGSKCRTCGEEQAGGALCASSARLCVCARARACERAWVRACVLRACVRACGAVLARGVTDEGTTTSAACHLIPHVCQVCGLSFTALTNSSRACKVHPLCTIVVSAPTHSPLRASVYSAWRQATHRSALCRWSDQVHMPRTHTPRSSGNVVQTSRILV